MAHFSFSSAKGQGQGHRLKVGSHQLWQGGSLSVRQLAS